MGCLCNQRLGALLNSDREIDLSIAQCIVLRRGFRFI